MVISARFLDCVQIAAKGGSLHSTGRCTKAIKIREKEVKNLEQRSPPIRHVVLEVAVSLVILFVIALISCITDINIIQLAIGYLIIMLSLKLNLKNHLRKVVENIIIKMAQKSLRDRE